MGKKVAKSTRKFAASGQLKKTIQARRKHQQVKKKIDRRKGKGKPSQGVSVEDEDEEKEEEDGGVKGATGKCVFSLL
jgi:nucleolar complex protein 2